MLSPAAEEVIHAARYRLRHRRATTAARDGESAPYRPSCRLHEARALACGTAWDRLAAAMDAMGQEAAVNGLTPAALESLISDES